MEIKSGEEGVRGKLLSELSEANSIKARVDGNIEKLVKSGQPINSHRGNNLAGQRRLAESLIADLEAELSNLVQ